MDRKMRLVDIFQDTQQFYNTNPALAAAVAASKAGTQGRHLLCPRTCAKLARFL